LKPFKRFIEISVFKQWQHRLKGAATRINEFTSSTSRHNDEMRKSSSV